MEQKSVIIIVPCAELNEYVVECLRGCLRLDYANYRIALLPDAHLELPEEFRNDAITVMPTGDVTISAKRNLAMSSFPDAAYYAFIDSDAYPQADWLKNGVGSFFREDIWAVGGPNVTPPNDSLEQKAVGNAARSFLVSGHLAFAKEVSADRYCLNLHSCNLIVAAQAIKLVGGFQEELKTGEDRELCHRIRKNGGKIYFRGSVVVFHHNRHFGRHFFMQRVIHGYSIFSIMKKDKGWSNVVLFIPLIGSILIGMGLLVGVVYPLSWIMTAACIACYVLLTLKEAVRTSNAYSELPLTLAAIVTSNTGYVLGTILGMLGVKLNFKKMYGNYQPSDRIRT